MHALQVLCPVFIMMGLGLMSRLRGWITAKQIDGAKQIVFGILFPFLVFNALVLADLQPEFIRQIFVVDALWIALFVIGRRVVGGADKKFGLIAPYMLMTSEGGSVALPLYLTLVGSAYTLNIVTFDVGGILINFGLVPLLVARATATKIQPKEVVCSIVKSPFMVAVILGIACNLLGFYPALQSLGYADLYNNSMSQIITPIGGMILFILGFDLNIRRDMLSSLAKLAALRLIGCIFIITALWHIFPNLAATREYQMAILLYFMCPTGFPVPLQVKPLVKDEEDEQFMSAFLSLFMIVALIAYTVITFVF